MISSGITGDYTIQYVGHDTIQINPICWESLYTNQIQPVKYGKLMGILNSAPPQPCPKWSPKWSPTVKTPAVRWRRSPPLRVPDKVRSSSAWRSDGWGCSCRGGLGKEQGGTGWRRAGVNRCAQGSKSQKRVMTKSWLQSVGKLEKKTPCIRF